MEKQASTRLQVKDYNNARLTTGEQVLTCSSYTFRPEQHSIMGMFFMSEKKILYCTSYPYHPRLNTVYSTGFFRIERFIWVHVNSLK